MQEDTESVDIPTEKREREYVKVLRHVLRRRAHYRNALKRSHPAYHSTPAPTTSNQIVPSVYSSVKQRQRAELEQDLTPTKCFYAFVAVCDNFKHVPSLSDKTKELATALYNTLVDTNYGHFTRKGSKLLVNPSVIEFQETVKELQLIYEEEMNDSTLFFLLLSHGARVTNGDRKGSYILFPESRLSSEEELVLTAIHEKELIESIHSFRCKNKLIALEVCQHQDTNEILVGDLSTSIRTRVDDKFTMMLFNKLKARHMREHSSPRRPLQQQQHQQDNQHLHDDQPPENQPKDQPDQPERSASSSAPSYLSKSKRKRGPTDPLEGDEEADFQAIEQMTSDSFRTIVLDSCDVQSEIPSKHPVDNVSNFLHRLLDGFRGGVLPMTSEQDKASDFATINALEMCLYVQQSVVRDADAQNAMLKAQIDKQKRNTLDSLVQVTSIQHTSCVWKPLMPSLTSPSQLVDFNFCLSRMPSKPSTAPSPPQFVSATERSITVTWTAPAEKAVEFPIVLGYHLQFVGAGRAMFNEEQEENEVIPWKTASSLHVSSYDELTRTPQEAGRQIQTFGLNCDTGYRFRVRARTAGGWGPFSAVSEVFRTASAIERGARSIDLVKKHLADHLTKASTARSSTHLAQLMQTRQELGQVQRDCLQLLAQLAIDCKLEQISSEAVKSAVEAMQRFPKDRHIQFHGALLVSRLISDEASRSQLLKQFSPLGAMLRKSHQVFRSTHPQTSLQAKSALDRLEKPWPKPRLRLDAAARRIQGMYRRRQARQQAQEIAQLIYRCLRDPTTGQTYFYNTRTGASSWAPPRVLSTAK